MPSYTQGLYAQSEQKRYKTNIKHAKLTLIHTISLQYTEQGDSHTEFESTIEACHPLPLLSFRWASMQSSFISKDAVNCFLHPVQKVFRICIREWLQCHRGMADSHIHTHPDPLVGLIGDCHLWVQDVTLFSLPQWSVVLASVLQS